MSLVVSFASLNTVVAAVPDESQVEPGAIGTLIVLGLIIATVFLLRSMLKRISKIQVPRADEIEEEEERARREASGTSGASGGSGTSGGAGGSGESAS